MLQTAVQCLKKHMPASLFNSQKDVFVQLEIVWSGSVNAVNDDGDDDYYVYDDKSYSQYPLSV